MKKTVLSVLLCAAMALSLAACGKGGNTGGTGNAGKTDNTSQKADTAAAADDEAASKPAAAVPAATEAAAEEAAQVPFVPSKEDTYSIYDVMNETVDSGDYEYYVNADDTALITWYRGEEESVAIPAEIDGHTVTGINHRAFSSSYVKAKEITIPATVTAIYGNPFNECRTLETIKADEGNKAFTVTDNCLIRLDGMTLVSCPGAADGICKIPEGVKVIGDWSFADVYNCSEVVMPDSITEVDDYAFIRSGVGSVSFSPNLQKIGDYGFAYCYFSTLDLPQGLKSVGEMAFSGSGIEELNLPEGVESLGDGAFNNSQKLRKASLPASLGEIAGNPFSGCPGLSEVNLAADNKVLSISDSCLINNDRHVLVCYMSSESVAEITVPDGILEINAKAFQGQESLTTVRLPEGLKVIGESAFDGCKNLVSVNLPEGLTTIGNDAFNNDDKLTDIKIPDSLETLGANAFYWCSSITEINIPGTVKTVGRYTFGYCSGLVKVTIGEGTELIDEAAFNSCSALAEVTLPETLTTIKKDAFRYCTALKTIYLPESLSDIHYSAFEKDDELDAAVKKGSYAEGFCQENNVKYHEAD